MSSAANREAFYRERDDRTNRLLGRESLGELPVHVAIDAAMSESVAGQVLALSLINQLVRVHRAVSVDLPSTEIPLLATVPFHQTTLRDTIEATVRTIDPYCELEMSREPRHSTTVRVAVGAPRSDCQIYLSCSGAAGRLDSREQVSDLDHPLSTWGAGVASCLGAGAVLATHLGRQPRPTIYSVWNYAGSEHADPGSNETGPVDVGRVLMIGAGAVASALVYWLFIHGVRGSWTIVDEDQVALHNTNRSLLFTPADTAWFGKTARLKAEVLRAYLPGSRVEPVWFDRSSASKSLEFDLVLCVANERDVRTSVAQRNSPITLHATTSGWECSLHRHVCGIDDCARCRMRDVRTPEFGCSSASVQTAGSESSVDSALPFASAGAGLMLASALRRLQSGELHTLPRNRWSWDFGPYPEPQASAHSCEAGCLTRPDIDVCRAVYKHTKWAHLAGLDLQTELPR